MDNKNVSSSCQHSTALIKYSPVLPGSLQSFNKQVLYIPSKAIHVLRPAIYDLCQDVLFMLSDYLTLHEFITFITITKQMHVDNITLLYKAVNPTYHLLLDITHNRKNLCAADKHVEDLALYYATDGVVIDKLISRGASMPDPESFSKFLRTKRFALCRHWSSKLAAMHCGVSIGSFATVNSSYSLICESLKVGNVSIGSPTPKKSDVGVVIGSTHTISSSNNLVYGSANSKKADVKDCIALGIDVTLTEDGQFAIGSARHPISVTTIDGKNYIKVLLNGKKARIPIEFCDE